MGLLLVFFPEDQNKTPNNSINNTSKFLRRTTSSNLLFTKALSTITVCALFIFTTLLIFSLSTNFEPSSVFFPIHTVNQKPNLSSSPLNSFALQKMGTLYRRGTKAMNDLIVNHVIEDVTEHDLKLFLRVLHRSGITSKSDVIFLFGSSLFASRFESVIREENESFFKLIQRHYKHHNESSHDSVFGFDPTRFWKTGKKDLKETIWGKKGRGNYNYVYSNATESTRLIYGSIVGFDVSELDPENSLGGFLDDVPMSLRRWACYPMLLGRIRRNFKHTMLLDVKDFMLLSDPLGRIRNRSVESVYLFTKETKHGKLSSERTQSHRHLVNSGILMGGAKGIRRLCNAMLTEIVRATMQHKKKGSITESAILNQLVGNGFILKNVKLITSTESIQEMSSLVGLSRDSASDYSIIHRGNSNHSYSVIMKLICLSEVESSVYRDC